MARQRRQSGRSSAGRKTTAKRSTTKRTTAKRSTAKRSTTKRATTKRTTAKRSTAKRSTTKRSTTKRATAKRSTAKRSASKRSTARRGGTSRSAGSGGVQALSKEELVERLDRRLGRLKRDELQKLVEGVEGGSVNLASVVGGGTARATTPRSATGIAPPLARGAAKPSGGAVKLDSLQDVLQEQLEDLYSAETQLVEALPKVAGAASKGELRQAFEHHLEETREHVRRLETIFRQVGISSPTEYCEGMEGLIREGEEIVAAKGDAAAKDAALIAAAQRIEHYEIAGYGTARTLADDLGHGEAKRLLEQTLDEEKNADTLLNRLATGGRFGSGINEEAAEQT